MLNAQIWDQKKKSKEQSMRILPSPAVIPKLVENSYGLKLAHFSTFWLILKIFLKNYHTKLEIKGVTESKKPVMWIFPAKLRFFC